MNYGVCLINASGKSTSAYDGVKTQSFAVVVVEFVVVMISVGIVLTCNVCTLLLM